MAQNLYESPPGSGHNDGATPTVYVSGWELFTNLSRQQITAFESFPVDLLNYIRKRRSQAEASTFSVLVPLTSGAQPTALVLSVQTDDKVDLVGLRQALDDGLITTSSFSDVTGNFFTVDVSGGKALHQAAMTYIQSLWIAANSLATGINATPPTVTTRQQVDAVIAAIAPNSPSAKNPSP